MKTKHYTLIFLLIPYIAVAGGTYDPILAVTYAKSHARSKDYNKSYQSFEEDGVDCTNFFSQNLRAGGLTDDKRYKWIYPSLLSGGGSLSSNKNVSPYVQFLGESDISNWYYSKSAPSKKAKPSEQTYSLTWINANSMASRLISGYDGWNYVGKYDLKSTSNLSVEYGDAVFVQWKPETTFDINHAMLVTGFKQDGKIIEPVLTYHTSNRLNRPFSIFKKATLDVYINNNPKIYVFRRSVKAPKIYTSQILSSSEIDLIK